MHEKLSTYRLDKNRFLFKSLIFLVYKLAHLHILPVWDMSQFTRFTIDKKAKPEKSKRNVKYNLSKTETRCVPKEEMYIYCNQQ